MMLLVNQTVITQTDWRTTQHTCNTHGIMKQDYKDTSYEKYAF